MWRFRVMWFAPEIEGFYSFESEDMFESFLDACTALDSAVDRASKVFPNYSEDWIIHYTDIYMEVFNVQEDGEMGPSTGKEEG